MHVDKAKLKSGLWYEDKDGNVLECGPYEMRPEGAVTYHTRYPFNITENIYRFHEDPKTCKHRKCDIQRTSGWAPGYKGCKCNRCGSTKLGKSYVPFMFMKWREPVSGSSYHAISFHTHVGKDNEGIILAMANSGDYTLGEAVITYATACERCMNALAWIYTHGEEGYAPDSEEYKKCNTVCDFCREG